MVKAVRPGGEVLDLQVIRPNPVVLVNEEVFCEIDGEPLFRTADAAVAAVDALVRAGRLAERAVDDHDVREHFDNGADLIDEFAGRRRKVPAAVEPALREVLLPCVVRERCRLRHLHLV
jgi:hypothetical protein